MQEQDPGKKSKNRVQGQSAMDRGHFPMSRVAHQVCHHLVSLQCSHRRALLHGMDNNPEYGQVILLLYLEVIGSFQVILSAVLEYQI